MQSLLNMIGTGSAPEATTQPGTTAATGRGEGQTPALFAEFSAVTEQQVALKTDPKTYTTMEKVAPTLTLSIVEIDASVRPDVADAAVTPLPLGVEAKPVAASPAPPTFPVVEPIVSVKDGVRPIDGPAASTPLSSTPKAVFQRAEPVPFAQNGVAQRAVGESPSPEAPSARSTTPVTSAFQDAKTSATAAFADKVADRHAASPIALNRSVPTSPTVDQPPLVTSAQPTAPSVQLAEAIRTAPVLTPAPTDAAAQVAEAIRIRPGEQQLTVRLDPADLGTVRIEFTFDRAAAVTAIVAADHPSTEAMLRRHSEWLQQALADAGLEGAQIGWAERGRSDEASWQTLALLSEESAVSAQTTAMETLLPALTLEPGRIDVRL